MLPPVLALEAWRGRRDGAVLVDVRRDLPGLTAQQAYDGGHLPGAVLLDLDRWLAGPPSPQDGRHPLPSPEVFAEGLARAGVGDDDEVVAYDAEGGVVAARLVWMLRATGGSAALLDGGTALQQDLTERTPAVRARAARAPRPWPAALLADLDEVLAGVPVLLDARPRERFAGAPDPLDPRPGHVPGARSVPARESLGPDGRLLPQDVLRRRLEEAGAGEGVDVVSGCGSGVTACHTLLVREHVGLGRGRLWAGSWSQWAADPDRPAESDEQARASGDRASRTGPAGPA